MISFFRSQKRHKVLGTEAVSTSSVPDTSDIPTLELAAEQGQDDGGRDVPRSDATDLSSFEQKMQRNLQNARTPVDNKVAREISELHKMYSDCSPERMLETLEQELEKSHVEGEATAKAIANYATRDQQQFGANLQSVKRRLQDRKRLWRHVGTGMYPDSEWLFWGTLAIVLIGETVVNGLFFSDSSDAGLLGGATIAIGLSLWNVALGIALSFTIGWSTFPTFVKWLARVSVAAMATIVVMTNLYVARWRDMLSIDPDTPFQFSGLVNTFRDISFPQTFNGLILLFVGLAVVAIAGAKFWATWGRDIFYGRYQREYNALCDERLERVQEVDAEAKATILRVRERLTKLMERFQRSKELAQEHKTDATNRRGEYLSLVRSFEQLWKECCTLYREENVYHRSTPPPEYFDKPIPPPEFHGIEDPAEWRPHDPAPVAPKAREAIAAAIKKVEDLVSVALKEYTAMVADQGPV